MGEGTYAHRCTHGGALGPISLCSERKKQRGEEVNKEVDGPDHCIHCDEDPCVFIQIESGLCKNNEIYFDEQHNVKDPVSCNSGRRKRAYQYAAFVLWEGINYRKPHYK
jgi:hypothetical protein